MVDLTFIVKLASLGLSVAKYTNIIQDHLKIKVEELAGSELEAGLRALEQASNSQYEQMSLLREARSRFNKAISLEKAMRQAAAYIGLALCHSYLGDVVNTKHAFKGLLEITLPKPPDLLVVASSMNQLPKWVVFVPIPYLLQAKLVGSIAYEALLRHEREVAELVALQQSAKQLL